MPRQYQPRHKSLGYLFNKIGDTHIRAPCLPARPQPPGEAGGEKVRWVLRNESTLSRVRTMIHD
jgi:hypothetical protein